MILMLAALGCRSAEQAPLRVDPALAALVSSDAVFLAGVRMDNLRATPAYRKWVAGKPQPLLDRLAAEIGLDPRQDISELLIASDGKQMLAVARGKFGPQAAEQAGARRMSHKGFTLLGEENAAVVFLNPTTAAAGPAPALRALIDRRNRSRAPSPLLEKARTFPAGTQVWAISSDAGALADRLPSSGNLAMLGKILAMVESSTLAADLRSGLKLRATGACRNETDARTLSDGLRGLIGLARLSTPDGTPELLRVYDGIGVEQNQREVLLKAEIAQDLLDKLIARFEQGGLPAGLGPATPRRASPR